ncbi:MAG TPA: CapA family protein [Spirochaetota bacterium]|nr:CapA family protein [Spirochaetota bacterium]HPI89239.1 CapA family protein [Spirochaetota bacterium]HPR50073.1 CapA family protein [Spirochaetota bacterium]
MRIKVQLAITLFIMTLLLPGTVFSGELTISFTGDIMMHSAVKQCAACNNRIDASGSSTNNAGFDYLFEQVAPHFKKSDIIAGNLEFPIAAPFESQEIIFNCPPEVLQALKKTGFTMFSLANNHILDQGISGARETLDRVLQGGFDAAGANCTEEAARRGVIKKKGNLTVGFLACTGIINYPIRQNSKIHINWFYNEQKLSQDIINMKKQADFVVLMVHTGQEYRTEPEPADSALMKKYCDTGVDCIIGHHPHVLQPLEQYRASDGRLCHIFYSLGNFISNQSAKAIKSPGAGDINTEESIIVTLKVSKSIIAKKIKTRFSLLSIITKKKYNNSRECPDIQVVPLAGYLRQTRQGLKSGTDAVISSDRVNLLEEKSANIKKIIMGDADSRTIDFIE